MAPRDKTAGQTFPCKCKTCIFSVESDVYNKKKIQMFVVNMTFISSHEVKKCIFHSCLRHSWNIHFFTSLDEIKVIFTPNIWISSIYYCSTYERTDERSHRTIVRSITIIALSCKGRIRILVCCIQKHYPLQIALSLMVMNKLNSFPTICYEGAFLTYCLISYIPSYSRKRSTLNTTPKRESLLRTEANQ